MKRRTKIKNRVETLLYQTKISALDLLSNIGILHHHTNFNTEVIDSVIVPLPDLVSERFIYGVSYMVRTIRHHNHDWYENSERNRVFTHQDSVYTENRISYRAELKRFIANLSPGHTIMVEDPKNVRYAFEYSMGESKVDHSVALQFSLSLLRNYLTEEIPKVNETLTGVKHDGALLSSKGYPLADNVVCRSCGTPVFTSPKDGYYFECVNHGELDSTKIVVIREKKKYLDLVQIHLDELSRS